MIFISSKKQSLILTILLIILVGGFYFSLFPSMADAQGSSYTPLAPIKSGNVEYVGNSVNTNDLTLYLNNMFKLGIAIAVALAVVMIIIGGVEYMSTDVVGKKEDGQGRINAALLGLVVALGSYMLLNTLDPDLLKANLNLQGLSTRNVLPDSTGNVLTGEDVGDENPEHTRERVTGVRRDPDGTAYIQYQNGDRTTVRPDGTRETTDPNGNRVEPTPPSPVAPLPGDAPVTPSTFPRQEWNDCALRAVNASQLPNLRPADADKYFPNGEVTAQGWVNLLAGTARQESGFNPNQEYRETFIDTSTGERTVSTGLLQLSQGSSRAYGFPGITTQQLKDPCKNIEVGVKIMERWAQRDGVIRGKVPATNNDSGWRGAGARYWSVFRTGRGR